MAFPTENERRATPGDDFRRDRPLDVEMQADPELQEGPAGAGRIAIYAVAIVILLGAVFFGLNSSPTTTASNPSPAPAATTADNAGNPPPAVRDVTPNRQPGTTTGAAPAVQPTQPPQANPTGEQVDRSKLPASN